MPDHFNIDIHCHPSTKPFMKALQKKPDAFKSFNHDIQSNFIKLIKRLLEKESEVLFASQSNFDHLFEGGHRVVIASITPMEKAFFVANLKRATPFIFDFKDLFIFDTTAPWEDTIKPKLINALMGFSIDCIEQVRGSGTFTDYFGQGLQPEYEYLIGHHNQQSSLHGFTIKFVKNFSEIENGLADDKARGTKTIYLILSIEGAHSFKTPSGTIGDVKQNQGRQHTTQELRDMSDSSAIEKNIRKMKREWEFPPLFVTMMHHFWNGMGGHARSLNKTVGEMLNQQEGINEPLSEKGKLVIRAFLQKQFDERVGNDIQTFLVPRILIDIKHMSIASRKDYYKMLDDEFAGENIPIICSHTGIAHSQEPFDAENDRESSLENLAKVIDKEQEQNDRNYFHYAQINLCGEDVRRIVKSRGLIGIQLDEKRIAGTGFVQSKLRGGLTNFQLMHECAKLIMANMFVAVNTVNTPDAWDVFCIGSDFDGLINHLDPFPTAADVSTLRDEIEFFLENLVEVNDPGFDFKMGTAEMKRLMMGLTASQITAKIFSENVMAFLSRNFRN